MLYVLTQHYIPEKTLSRMAGSELVILDGLMMHRHKSHFSIPQAIDCLLELTLRQSKSELRPPSLALLTDITHRVEHEHTEAELQRMLQGMRAWLHEQPEASERWWDSIWDMSENESSRRLALRVPTTAQAPSHHLVPPIHLAFDGLQVLFTKCRAT